MSIRCEIIERAKSSAAKKGLPVSEIDRFSYKTCFECDGNCPAKLNEDGTDSYQDRLQNDALEKLEGQKNLEKFYGRLEKHFQIVYQSKSKE